MAPVRAMTSLCAARRGRTRGLSGGSPSSASAPPADGSGFVTARRGSNGFDASANAAIAPAGTDVTAPAEVAVAVVSSGPSCPSRNVTSAWTATCTAPADSSVPAAARESRTGTPLGDAPNRVMIPYLRSAASASTSGPLPPASVYAASFAIARRSASSVIAAAPAKRR